MRTPEEIKKGMRGCEDKSNCEWRSLQRECHEDEDALAYIEQLEKRIEQAEKQIDTVHAELEATNRDRIRLMMQVAQLTKEREAAVADLREADRIDCEHCKHYKVFSSEECQLECDECVLDCPCKHCIDNSCWTWRGVQEGKE